jgi:hemerythrin superfamily protein
MDALELLAEDHARAKKVMQELRRTEGPDTRQALFAQLERDLDAHEAVEEEILYPALQPRENEIVLEGIEEHHVVDTLMVELDSLPFDDESWGARCRVMIGNIEHHMQEEEVELFPRARKVLGRGELAELGARMARRRDEILGQSWLPMPAVLPLSVAGRQG